MDRILVERAQGGDRDAYERLARASADRLYAVAHQITRDAYLAEDAVQQALVAMWRDLPSLRDPARFEAWTYRLVVRAALMDLRRRRSRPVVPIEGHDPPGGGGDPAAAIARRDELQRALAVLTPEHRAVIVLRHLVGAPLDEIAEVMGIPYGTAASRLHRATAELRAAVEAGDRAPALEGQPA